MWDLLFEPHLGNLEYFVTSGKPHRMHIYQRKKNGNRRALTLFCTSNGIKTEWQITVENCLVLQIIKFPQGEGNFHAVKSLLHGLYFSDIFLACFFCSTMRLQINGTIFFKYFIYMVSLGVCKLHSCACRDQKSMSDPWNWITDRYERSCGCPELNQCQLQEEQML